jgi:hypothetical protein
MRAKSGNKQLNRPQRPCISLSHNLLIQLSGLMTPLIPSSGKIRHIRISYMMSTLPGFLGGRLFVFQHSRDGSGRHSDHLRDLFFFVPSPKQLPNLLMPTNALGMALPPFLLSAPHRGCFGRRKRFSSKQSCNFFEQTLVVTKELLQCFPKVFLEMETIYYLFCLGSPCISGRAKDLVNSVNVRRFFG